MTVSLTNRCVRFLSVSAVACLLPFVAQAEYQKNFVGDMRTHIAVYEDTLIHLARRYEIGFVEIRAANPTLDPWIPGDGAEVVIPSRHLLPDAEREGIVINVPEMRVYAYVNDEKAPYTYPIGIGREGLATPLGETTVTRKKDGPTWRPTARMRKEDPKLPAVVPPGADNPLGTHALYLGWPAYLIHGTTKPYGIGRRVSSGCIRLYPEHIKKFFKQIPVGTKVNVIDQPVKVAWIENELFLEAHPDVNNVTNMELTGEVQKQKINDADMDLIIARAGRHHKRLNWPKIRQALRERNGYPVRIARYFDQQGQAEPPVYNGERVSDIKPAAGAVAVPDRKPGVKAVSTKPDTVIGGPSKPRYNGSLSPSGLY